MKLWMNILFLGLLAMPGVAADGKNGGLRSGRVDHNGDGDGDGGVPGADFARRLAAEIGKQGGGEEFLLECGLGVAGKGPKHRVLQRGLQEVPSIVEGQLGRIPVGIFEEERASAFDFSLSKAAGDVLLEVLRDYFGSDQDFEDQVIPQGKPLHAEQGGFHQRFIQKINNYSVEGASLVVHIDSTGELVAVNGEFVEGKGLSMIATLTSKQALTIAINSWYKDRDTLPEVIGAAKLTVVRNSMDGSACFAWKAPVQFVEDVVVSLDKDFQEVVTKLDEHSGKRKLRQDYVFANAQNGEPCAIYPKVFGFDDGHSQEEEQENVGEIPSSRRLEVGDTPGTPFIETYDCHQTTDEATCILVSNAATNLTTGDLAIDSAHNYAIATYKYYWDNFQRDSIDDAGMLLKSFVHWDVNYNNAFWNGVRMTYGDGDGTIFQPLSQDADVVAHELTHGVTENTSGLIYRGESGALNEAMSDIFGAMVDRATGATGADIWTIGEDIYTPGTPGDGGIRNMADPHHDWYPSRYTGDGDRGGVHFNSGIANLAFYLLVMGGTHPSGKSSVNVAAIGFDAAAKIFYEANIACLTPDSTFFLARYCTAAVTHREEHRASVHAAWDAVGVPATPTPEGWEYKFILKFDNYPGDITWAITDSCINSDVLSGGSYGPIDAMTEKTFYLYELSSYTLTINDTFGDGICCSYGNGGYTVTDLDNTVLVTGGAFGHGETVNFGTPCPLPSTSPSSAPSFESVSHDICENFAVFARTTVTFDGVMSTIEVGDVGVSPGTSITGDYILLDGQVIDDSADFAASVMAAHVAAMAVRDDGQLMAIEIGGLTFTPGTYRSGSAINFAHGTVVTLDGLNDPNPVFLFQAKSTLVTAADTYFNLINGARAENVLWALGTAATLGARSIVEGSILAGTAITFGTNSELRGCALAQSAVTFESEGSVVVNHYIADATATAPP